MKNYNKPNPFCSRAVKRMMLDKLNERFQARRQDSKKAVTKASKGVK